MPILTKAPENLLPRLYADMVNSAAWRDLMERAEGEIRRIQEEAMDEDREQAAMAKLKEAKQLRLGLKAIKLIIARQKQKGAKQ